MREVTEKLEYEHRASGFEVIDDQVRFSFPMDHGMIFFLFSSFLFSPPCTSPLSLCPSSLHLHPLLRPPPLPAHLHRCHHHHPPRTGGSMWRAPLGWWTTLRKCCSHLLQTRTHPAGAFVLSFWLCPRLSALLLACASRGIPLLSPIASHLAASFTTRSCATRAVSSRSSSRRTVAWRASA